MSRKSWTAALAAAVLAIVVAPALPASAAPTQAHTITIESVTTEIIPAVGVFAQAAWWLPTHAFTSDCVKDRGNGKRFCHSLDVRTGPGLDMSVKLHPYNSWDYGKYLHHELVVKKVGSPRGVYTWDDNTTCFYTGGSSCDMRFVGACERGAYNVTGFVWYTNRDWITKTTLAVRVN